MMPRDLCKVRNIDLLQVALESTGKREKMGKALRMTAHFCVFIYMSEGNLR